MTVSYQTAGRRAILFAHSPAPQFQHQRFERQRRNRTIRERAGGQFTAAARHQNAGRHEPPIAELGAMRSEQRFMPLPERGSKASLGPGEHPFRKKAAQGVSQPSFGWQVIVRLCFAQPITVSPSDSQPTAGAIQPMKPCSSVASARCRFPAGRYRKSNGSAEFPPAARAGER